MSDTAPPDSCVEPTPFCCPDDLKDLGLVQDDQNHRVWSFANLEELLRVLN